MTKRAVCIGDEESTLTEADDHFVVVRPKAIIDSSGTTWASEIVQLRILFPDTFEVLLPSESPLSARVRGELAKLQYRVFQYMDMTTEMDILKVSTEDTCKHRMYELKRLKYLMICLEEVLTTSELHR